MDEVGFKLYLLTEHNGKKRKRTERTIDLHLSLLRRLQKSCPDLTLTQINAFFLDLLEKGRKGTYINDYVDMLHLYGRFKKITTYDSLAYFPEDPFEKATMSDEEIEAFLNLEPQKVTRYDPLLKKEFSYYLGLRRWKLKTMFWKCLAYSGARPGEIAQLKISDVDFGRQVFLVDGKTGHRQIPIAPLLLPELQEYIKDLKTEFLFPAERGGKTRQNGCINDVAWGYDFHQRLKRLGIKRKNLTPYSLRHSFVTRFLSEDINIFKVQKIVGHKRLETTQGYTHLTTKDIIKTISQDPLSRQHLSYNERFLQFRNNVRQLLSTYCTDVLEESQFLKDLVGSG